MLDQTEQRIIGVLIEKEATVPDTYPLSENALVDGCNQKNNRDPLMDLVQFQVAGALMALQEKGWIARLDGHGRVTKYRHKVIERLGLTKAELAVLCELLVRGAQAPGALKPRVQRLGFLAEVADIDAVLHKMLTRPQPLVEQLPLAPRERDRRWRHLLGPVAASQPSLAAVAAGELASPPPLPAASAPTPVAAAPAASARHRDDDLAPRVAALEQQVAELRAIVTALQAGGAPR